jgi:hypothetical protein
MSSSEDDNRYTNDINYKHAERERDKEKCTGESKENTYNR